VHCTSQNRGSDTDYKPSQAWKQPQPLPWFFEHKNQRTTNKQRKQQTNKTKQAKQTTAKPSNRPASSQQQKQNTTKNTIDCRARGQCHPALFLLLLLGSFVIINHNKNNQQQKQISEPVEEIGI